MDNPVFSVKDAEKYLGPQKTWPTRTMDLITTTGKIPPTSDYSHGVKAFSIIYMLAEMSLLEPDKTKKLALEYNLQIFMHNNPQVAKPAIKELQHNIERFSGLDTDTKIFLNEAVDLIQSTASKKLIAERSSANLGDTSHPIQVGSRKPSVNQV